MNILIIGSGGREHTFAHYLAQSPKCNKLYVAPGNGGTSQLAENVSISVSDFDALKEFIEKNDINTVVVGPEVPLVEGIYDFLTHSIARDITVIGPSKQGALLEGSKEFAKAFMKKYKIPTAAYKAFTKETLEEGKAYLENLSPPYVLKADGLAAGKGVLILNDLGEAKSEFENMLVNEKFGEASKTVVIEEFLDGNELSVFIITDGLNYKILPTAKDYKRIGEGDTGLNTGGMGAISPVPFATAEFMRKVEEKIIKPTVNGIQKEEINYQGFLFFGLINVKGEPYVIEYNVRMGDPETEVVLPRIRNDWVEIFNKVARKRLNEIELDVNPQFATTVMLVSGGYPEEYEKGKEITGISQNADALLFHAGTAKRDGTLVTNGGRVMAVTSFGDSFEEALKNSYAVADNIKFENKYYRKDLGFDL